VIVLTAAASSIFWSARTQMVTFVGTVAVVAILSRWRERPDARWVWWLVPVFLVWVNGHGGVVYGWLILVGTVVGARIDRRTGRRPLPRDAVRTLTAVAVACTAVLVLNPSGPRVYGLPFHQVSASTQFVEEYQRPDLTDPTAWPFFVLLGLTVALMVWRRTSVDAVDVLLVAGSAAFALQFTRSIPFFAVVAAPVIARLLTEIVGDRARSDDRAADRHLLFAAVALVAVVGVLGFRSLDSTRVDERLHAEFPVAATDWIAAERPPGELFNTFNWGGYLMWELPRYRVSIDGRTDVYDEYLDVYHDTISARPGWEDELDREGIGTVLVDVDAPLADALRADGTWRVGYEDEVAVVFVRGPA
jgi:hypothetical protein